MKKKKPNNVGITEISHKYVSHRHVVYMWLECDGSVPYCAEIKPMCRDSVASEWHDAAELYKTNVGKAGPEKQD